ncbi:uncharacterized protein LOC141534992 [Cotesia typhae]|uniref:uncharacterized protein LOC141534992 n=1 Tax=Cotesia typhae TaxID=2053667 RepID=UPI003D68EC25
MSLSEKRYQLAAHKRNISDQKFNYYSQTAQYFERESQKTKQFNTWNVDVKSIRWDNIKKAETLNSRRNKLQVLLKNEEQAYKRECDQLKARKDTKEKISLEVLEEKLKEKRAELSLYNPNIHRRLKSYFTNPAETERVDSKLQNIAEPITRNLSRLSFDNSNYLKKRRSDSPFKNNCNSPYNYKSSLMDYSNEQNEKAFDERADAFTENRDYSMSDRMDYSKKDPVFVPDRKYKERYAHRSLENTNVFDTAGHTHDIYEQQAITNGALVVEASDDGMNDKCNLENQGNDSVDFISNENVDNQESNPGEEMNNSKETESDYPEEQAKGPLTTITNSSDMMVLYLMYNDLQKKIEDLEVKESRACLKHLWEETLRLRDMRNRLELLREKKIYQRRDLHIDPSSKEAALNNIEKRSSQLKEREDTCADSKMYSEDAKRIWEKWIAEDKKSPISKGDELRKALMNQLADEWESLGENDKKIISQSYAEVMRNASLEIELNIMAKKGFH